MPQYDFASPGADMNDALTQFLLESQKLKRQAMLDQITKRKADADISASAAQTELARQNAGAAKDTRDFARANTISENSLPNEEYDAATQELMTRAGLGGAMHKVSLPGDVQQGGETADTRDPNREAVVSRGGSKYNAARIAAGEKADMAAQVAADKAEQAKTEGARKTEEATKDRELKKFLGEMANSGHAASRAILDQLNQQKLDDAKTKSEEGKKAKENSAKGIQDSANGVLESLDQLLDKDGNLTDGTSNITGRFRTPEMLANAPLIGGGETANKYAAFNTLKSRLIVDLLAQMKAQSKTGATGFGQLSEKEGAILANAAGQLQNSQTPEQLATQLKLIREKVSKIVKEPAAAKSKYKVTVGD